MWSFSNKTHHFNLFRLIFDSDPSHLKTVQQFHVNNCVLVCCFINAISGTGKMFLVYFRLDVEVDISRPLVSVN